MKKSWLIAILLTVSICCLGCSNKNKVVLVNDSSTILTALYISPVSDGYWNVNQLNDWVYPGESYTITDISDDCYDLKVVNYDGYCVTRWDVCLSGNDQFTWRIIDAKSLEKDAETIGVEEGAGVVCMATETNGPSQSFMPGEVFKASGGTSEAKSQ